jgi:thiol-disulfide isomerase/thioredoxin
MSKNKEKDDFLQQIKKINSDSSSYILNDTKLKEGFKKFTIELKKQKPELLQNNYSYINIWNIICKPCFDEIPFIDNLSEKINKNISYVMVSSHSNGAVNKFIENKNLKVKNFIFINEMIDFISGIYNEIEVKSQSWPLHVVLDGEGTCLAFLFGSIHSEDSAAPLINFINDLK